MLATAVPTRRNLSSADEESIMDKVEYGFAVSTVTGFLVMIGGLILLTMQ